MDDMLRQAEQMMQGEPMYEKISFYDEEQDGFADFFVLDRTRVNGTEYLLATQELNQDSEGYIFKVISEQRDENNEETLELELVEDETEMEAVGRVFSELMGDELNIQV